MCLEGGKYHSVAPKGNVAVPSQRAIFLRATNIPCVKYDITQFFPKAKIVHRRNVTFHISLLTADLQVKDISKVMSNNTQTNKTKTYTSNYIVVLRNCWLCFNDLLSL